MRSLKELVVPINKMVSGCYYKVTLDDNSIWVFKFICFDGEYIISGESYCVNNRRLFHNISTLCTKYNVIDGTLFRVSLNRFKRIKNK